MQSCTSAKYNLGLGTFKTIYSCSEEAVRALKLGKNVRDEHHFNLILVEVFFEEHRRHRAYYMQYAVFLSRRQLRILQHLHGKHHCLFKHYFSFVGHLEDELTGGVHRRHKVLENILK